MHTESYTCGGFLLDVQVYIGPRGALELGLSPNSYRYRYLCFCVDLQQKIMPVPDKPLPDTPEDNYLSLPQSVYYPNPVIILTDSFLRVAPIS